MTSLSQTLNGSTNRKSKRTHGFRSRSQHILRARRQKGRKRLSV